VSTKTKDLHHRLTGDPTSLEGALARGNRALTAAERAAKRLEQQQARTHRAMERVGRTMLVAGAAIAAGIGLSVRAAIRWESAWAGVAKVLETATAPQLAILEDQLRGLAQELPQSHEEIAAVAAAAGQLGVAAPDIANFTRTMVDLGVATNLSSEEAAFALARLSTIMGTARDDVGRMGAAIVDLGNNSATTEADIVEMALRISGAGRTIGLSEAEVLGFAAALSSAGVAAQAGGTAISKVFIQIEGAVRSGGQRLDQFAQVAGVSAERFRRHYERDAAGAIATFVEGLGRIQRQGGDTFKTLETLGITEVRMRDALLRLAGAGDLVSRSLEVGNRGWDENRALLEEAERRYATVEARMSIAKNQVNDFAISIGQTLLPVVGDMVDRIGAFASLMGDLPGPVRAALAVVGVLTAALLLAGGTALLAVPKIHKMRVALDHMALAGGRAALASRALRAIPWGPLGIALGVATVAFGVFAARQAEARARVQELSDTLDQQTGALTGNTRAWVAHRLETDGILERAEKLGLDLATVTDAVLGEADAVEVLNTVLDEHRMSSQQMEDARRAHRQALMAEQVGWQDATTAAEAHGFALTEQGDRAHAVAAAHEQLTGDLEAAQAATRRQAAAAGEAAEESARLTPEQARLGRELGLTAGTAAQLTDELSDLDKELKALFDSVFALQNAQDALDDQFDRLREQVKTQRDANDAHAGSLDGSSQAARRNRAETQKLLREYGDLALKTITATNSQEDAEAAAGAFEAALDDLRDQTGLNVRELEGYNEVVAEIERLINITFNNPGAVAARLEAERLKRTLDEIDRTVNIGFTSSGFIPGGGFQVARQHGGVVPGSGGIDSVRAALTPREFVTTPSATSRNRAALEAANAGARLAVVSSGGGSTSGGSTSGGGGFFEGELYLDSGAFLGVVRGEIHEAERVTQIRARQGVGAAR
jgi:TP901 family phage tail tape measure protein